MQQRLLGNSGCVVSSVGLGTMTFGRDTDESEAFAMLDRFVEAGGSLIDTADVYGEQAPGVPGEASERIICAWLASRPRDVTDQIVLATKGRFATDSTPNGTGLSARHLGRALDASLQRFGVDVIDVYQAHAFDPLTPVEETVRVMDGFVRAGKIRYYGLSNFLGWQLTEAVHMARALGLAPPITLQLQYNLLSRDVEWEVLPAARHARLGLLPWSPLAGRWLTGKYRRDEAPGRGSRFDEDPMRGMQSYEERTAWPRTWAALDALAAVAARHQTSQSRVALAWLDRQEGVSAILLGARTVAQLDDNLGFLGLDLRCRPGSSQRRYPSRRERLPLRGDGRQAALATADRWPLTRKLGAGSATAKIDDRSR